MTRVQLQARINELREELEHRFKFGMTKMASPDGTPISSEKLQNELYSLIYKLSKRE